MNLLVKFDKNWADEFDVYGFAIMSEEDFNFLMKHMDNVNFFFGSNQGWEDRDLRDGFTAKPIHPDDEATLRALFPELERYDENSYGVFPGISEVLDHLYSQALDDTGKDELSEEEFEEWRKNNS